MKIGKIAKALVAFTPFVAVNTFGTDALCDEEKHAIETTTWIKQF